MSSKILVSLVAISGLAIADSITSAPSAYSTPSSCEAVQNSCIQSGISAGTLNEAYCGALSASCAKTASSITSAPKSTSTNSCDAVQNSCIQSGISAGTLNEAYCGALSQSCASKVGSMTITSSTSSASSTSPCDAVRNSCIQSGISASNLNEAFCAAQSQKCLQTVSSTMTMTSKPSASSR